MPAPFDCILRFLVFAAVHSLLASDRFRSRICRLTVDGSTPPWYRLAYNGIALFTLSWVMMAWPTAPVLYVVPGSGYLALRAVQAILLLLALRCLGQTGLGAFLGFTPQPAPPSLVTTGCYGIVRHPLYLLGLLFMLAEPAPSAQWLLLTGLSLGYCLLALRWEEARLLDRFGTPYRAYRNAVPALIPGLRRNSR